MQTLKTALGTKAVTKTKVNEEEIDTPVPAFAYDEITDFALVKANLYYSCVFLHFIFLFDILFFPASTA